MKKLLLLLIIPFLSFGQGWINFYDPYFNTGGSTFNYVIQTDDGGYATTGQNIMLLKTDSNGNLIGYQVFDSGYSVGNCIKQTNDGGYVVAGYNVLADYPCMRLTKYDSNGNLEWDECYSDGQPGAEYGDYVHQHSDGGFIIVGDFLVKTNSLGSVEWTNEDFSVGVEIQETTSGGYVSLNNVSIVNSEQNESFSSPIITKLNSQGEILWSQIYGDEEQNEFGISIKQTADEGYVCLISVINGYDILKMSEDGGVEWSQNYSNEAFLGSLNLQGTINNAEMSYINSTSDGGYVVSGQYSYNYFGMNYAGVFITKLNNSGIESWSQNYLDDPFGGDKYINMVEETFDEGYIICGSRPINEINEDRMPFLIKTDNNGDIISTMEFPKIKKSIITTIDILGRKTNKNKGLQLHIYDDGSVEKKYLIK